MKQVLQNLKTGELEVSEVAEPAIQPGHLLIKSNCTVISSGTERMLVDFARGGLISKARQQPEKAKQVISKIKTDGLMPTLRNVFARLDEPMPLGYCNCGTVLEVGEQVEGFQPGDRVVSNGPHAEIVCVPKNLCAKVPENVSDEEAAFTVIASIGLQGIRLIKPTFGETIVVYGLGLIGLIAVQLLKSSGCRVLGIDLNKKRLELARKFGAEIVDVSGSANPVDIATAYSNGKGVDAVLITASASQDQIVHQSAEMCRKKGRIVLVGVVNLDLIRSDFYEKELSFQVSCSYGPGRYDTSYEQKGHDYPYGFIRWTEQRNFEAILNAMADGKLEMKQLIGARIPQEKAQEAYLMLTQETEKIALILTYPEQRPEETELLATSKRFLKKSKSESAVVGLIGAGNFAKLTMLPCLKNLDIRFKTVADINGTAASYVARKFGFEQSTNDYRNIIEDPEINVVSITTRHNLHASMVIEALNAGKNVHVEKPLCLNREQMSQVKQAYQDSSGQLLVGFNRRFSPHAEKIRTLVQSRSGPLCMSWLVNAGMIPPSVWVQDRTIGGGRIIGEGCHWLDFMAFVVGEPIVSVSAAMISKTPGVLVPDDKVSITVRFAEGSIGTLHYFANGHKDFPKESFDLFCDGKILKLDNFRKLKGYGWKNFKVMRLMSQDKGHKAQFEKFISSIIHGDTPLVSFDEIENVTLASFAAVESAEGAGLIFI